MSASKARGGASNGRPHERTFRTPRQAQRAWRRAELRRQSTGGELGLLRLGGEYGLGFRERSLSQQAAALVLGARRAR